MYVCFSVSYTEHQWHGFYPLSIAEGFSLRRPLFMGFLCVCFCLLVAQTDLELSKMALAGLTVMRSHWA